MYDLQYIPSVKILKIVLGGRWEPEEYERFEQDYLTKMHELAGVDTYAILSDSRNFEVQSQDVANRFTRLTTKRRDNLAAAAIVVSSMTAKMQASRTLASSKMEVFTDLESAQEWLGEKLKVA